MKNKKGFTLIELLAVIIILGVLMLIAIPSVTEYIGVAKRKSYIATAKEYIGAVANKVNSLDLPISDTNTTYYVPIGSINLESGGKSPYGEWTDGYVVVTTDGTNNNYYWTSLDENGNAILLTEDDKLTNDSITTNVDELDLNVGVGNRDNIVVFNEDGTVRSSTIALSYIEEGGSIAEGVTLTPRPVITLVGQASIEVSFGSTYVDKGATATDDDDGDITASIVITNEVDTNTFGEQYVRYNVTNLNGLAAVEVVRTVTVVPIANPGYVISEGINAPMIINGLTAVKWNTGTSTWDTVADPNEDTSWYNYANKEWANAKSADGSIWVWVPRYAYQISTNYHTNTAGNINIKFIKGRGNTASDDSSVAVAPTYSGSSQTNYIVHPAFTFGTKELTGIWVAKFEMSGTTASLDSKPGATSIVNTSVANMFTSSRNMETNNKYGWALASGLDNASGIFSTDTNNIDTHMMKNKEWGAVAYLTQSTYGKNDEITKNNSTYAGGGSGNSYITNVGQSTTNNVYGIYDMSGGAWEYVMANYNNLAVSSGLTPSSINDKYIDRYSTTGAGYSSSNYGDAIYETSSNVNGVFSWYGDGTWMPPASAPWFMRGGSYIIGTEAGAFDLGNYYGSAYSYCSWRTVLLVDTGL